jgi:hypothetical protein
MFLSIHRAYESMTTVDVVKWVGTIPDSTNYGTNMFCHHPQQLSDGRPTSFQLMSVSSPLIDGFIRVSSTSFYNGFISGLQPSLRFCLYHPMGHPTDLLSTEAAIELPASSPYQQMAFSVRH